MRYSTLAVIEAAVTIMGAATIIADVDFDSYVPTALDMLREGKELFAYEEEVK